MIHSSTAPKRFGYSGGDVNDRIVPDEYKYNSTMINELIKQNKDLQRQVIEKQDEIDRLNVLIGSFRAKLIKYTELNKKLQKQHNVQPEYRSVSNVRVSSPVQVGSESGESLRIGKNERLDENRIDDIYERLETLTKLVDNAVNKEKGMSAKYSNLNRGPVSEDDIIVSESQEFKQLQDQIDLLKRKLFIKKENELRKLSLNKELADLMEELNMNGNNAPSSSNEDASSAVQNQRAPLHCEHCHQNIKTKGYAPEPRFVPLKESLETPTPTPTQTPRKLKREKDHQIANKQYSLW